MKKYIAVLIVLFIIGAILTILTFQQSKVLDDEVYLETTASIRNLKLLDNNVNLLLFGIHYQNKNSYDALEESNIELSEEFDNLRYEALLEEIESSDELQQANIDLEKEIFDKEEKISEFIEYNEKFLKSKEKIVINEKTKTAIENSDASEILSEQKNETDALIDLKIKTSKVLFYNYITDKNEENKSLLDDYIMKLKEDSSNSEIEQPLEVYLGNLSNSIELHEKSSTSFDSLLNSKTIEKINSLEEAYVNYHNLAIEKSGQLRNALIIYGFVLLGFLLFLAYLLRNQYLKLENKVAERTQEIQKAYTDLKESQEQLIQSEKMASLGEMVAGVAHEINTPLGYVNSNISTTKSNLKDISEVIENLGLIYSEAIKKERNDKEISSLLRSTLRSYRELSEYEVMDESSQLLEDAEHGVNEISTLVVSLKDFSRLDRKAVAEVNVHDCIDNALKIATNVIRENNIIIEKKYSKIPHIVCIPSKLNQLFLNIITNAAQAMRDNEGTLLISSEQEDNSVVLSFSDQGIGMNEETLQKMFDPFFTSKPIGEGTGLGMSIAYKIVQEHKGHIEVTSTPDVGTNIKITLPIEAT